MALEEFLETNGLYQLIGEPTIIRIEGSSCIDLIITDQPNFFVAYGVHPSLDEHCNTKLSTENVMFLYHLPLHIELAMTIQKLMFM